MAEMIRRSSLFLGVVFLVGMLNGCVNLEAVGKFADGAQALSEASGKFYEMELETDRQLAAMTVDLGAPENSADCSGTPWDCAVKGENLMAEARRNRAAISSLAEYARGLHEIATFNDDKNIGKASKELSGNLGDLSKTLDGSVNQKDQVLATAISSLAKVFVDLKVRDVIYEKVQLAHPQIKVITDVIRKDIKGMQTRSKITRLNAQATRETWFNGFRANYKDPEVNASEKATFDLLASQLVKNELRDILAVEPSRLFIKKFEATVESCVEAHQAIQKADLRGNSDTIIKFVGDARNLLSTLNQITH